MQKVQVAAPTLAWNVPIPQFVHPLEPDEEYMPDTQIMQFEEDDAPVDGR